MTDDDLFKACEQHGARRVYDAAYARLIGDLKALPAVRLPGIIDLSEAHTVLRVAYGCRRAENEAAGPALGGRSEHDQRDHGHPGEHEQGSSKRRERE